MNAAWTRYLPEFLRIRLEGRPQLQKAVGNSGWLFADRILRIGIGLVIGVWLARYLGPNQYGLYSYALAFTALFLPLTSLGLEDIIVRDIVRNPDCTNETLGTAFILKLIGSTASLVAAVGTIILLRNGDSQTHWLVGIIAAGSIFQAFNIIDCWFNSQVQAKYAVFAKSSAFFVCSVIKIVLIVGGASLTAFAWLATGEIVLGSGCLAIVYVLKGGSFISWQGSIRRAGSLLKDSWPLALSVIAMTIYQRIDQVMLGEIVGSEEVGVYSVAVRLAEFWIFIPTAFYWSVFPSIVRAKSVSDEQFYEKLQKFYNLMALSAYVVAIPMTFLGQWLVGFLYGEAYSRAGLMLTILVWANIFTFLELARGSFLATMNWTKTYFVTVLSGAILNIALNLVLIPRYGGLGAASASLISYWLAVHGSCFLFKPLFRTGAMMTRALFYPKIW
jgi:O-antigen/teichoic acid export membrane protein